MRNSRFALSRVDGTPLFYEEAGTSRRERPDSCAQIGEGQQADPRPDVVLCDGVGCDGYVWKHLLADLTPRYRTIHPHYRGHGRSPKPERAEAVRIEDLAEDVLSVLDDADSPSAVLMGHSMGVQVCLEVYRREPHRVAGLVLICGAPGHVLRSFRGNDALEPMLPGLRKAVSRSPRLFNKLARTLIPTQLAYALAAAVEIDARVLQEPDFMPYLEGLARVDVDLFLAMVASAAEHSAIDVLPTVRVPSLIVAGDRDGFTPCWRSREMLENIPRAEAIWIDGGSHTAPLEYPDVVGAGVLDFLQRRVAAAGPPAPRAEHPEHDDFD